MRNHKEFLKYFSLILIIKYHTTTTTTTTTTIVGTVLNKCYIHGFVQNAAHFFFYLHRRKLVTSPNCVCGAIANNKHYLLDCHRYDNARDEMLNIIIRYSNVTADILLFGNTDLPVRVNEENFQSCICLYSQNKEVHVP